MNQIHRYRGKSSSVDANPALEWFLNADIACYAKFL